MRITPQKYRTLLGRFATGVTLVTSIFEEKIYGLTVNSFTSVSIDPPLILICIDRTHETAELLKKSGAFAISILKENQEEISRRFSSAISLKDRFNGLDFREGITRSPILRDCAAYLECRLKRHYVEGDHIIFIAEIEAGNIDKEARPLLFYTGKYTYIKSP